MVQVMLPVMSTEVETSLIFSYQKGQEIPRLRSE